MAKFRIHYSTYLDVEADSVEDAREIVDTWDQESVEEDLFENLQELEVEKL